MGASGFSLSLAGIGQFQALAASDTRRIQASSDAANSLEIGPWTPPQWGQPALTILEVPVTTARTATSPITQQTDGVFTLKTGVATSSGPQRYVFDAVLKAVHNRSLEPTQQPVLTGAVMADHAYLRAARVTLDIGMSDVMAPFADGMWEESTTKSLSAWQVLKNLQVTRTLVNLVTRLDTYSNMLIVDVSSPDDVKTLHGLRATVVLQEILAGTSVATPPTSARPDATDSSASGALVYAVPVDPSQAAQHSIPSTLYPNVKTYPQVPGAGTISSNSLSNAQ